MPSWKAWVQRPCGLIKRGGKGKRFRWESTLKCRECGIEANMDYQS